MPELLAGNLPRSMARRKTVAKQWHAALAEGSARADAAAGAGDEERAADAVRRARRGDRVWAKIHGFPWWPAAVRDDDNDDAAAGGVRVRFFHTRERYVQAVGTVRVWEAMPELAAGRLPKLKSKAVAKQWHAALADATADGGAERLLGSDDEAEGEAEVEGGEEEGEGEGGAEAGVEVGAAAAGDVGPSGGGGGGGARALGELPVGWETAVAHEVTRRAKEKAVDVCDGLDAFAKHPLVKGSANEVLPHYVVGLYNLQTMGYVAASKRTRGALSKMTFDGA